MKTPLLLCLAILLQACDKTEEKPAPKIVTGPTAQENARRPSAPPTPKTAETPPAPATHPLQETLPPPTKEEVEALCTKVDALVKDATPALESPTPPAPEVRAALRGRMIELLKQRGKIMRAMTPDQRKELIVRLAPFAKIQQFLLMPPSLAPHQPSELPGDELPPPAGTAPPPGTVPQ